MDVEFLKQHGFVKIPGLLRPAELEKMQREIDAFVAAGQGGTAVFSSQATQADSAQADAVAAALIDSANTTAILYEADAPGVPNKLGHALHRDERFPAFCEAAQSPALRRVVGSLAACGYFPSPILMQSMVIEKAAKRGSPVLPHRDAEFLFSTTDLRGDGGRGDLPSLLAVWIALEDATLDNGCLWGLPGSHLPHGPWSDSIGARRYQRASATSRCLSMQPDGVASPYADLDVPTVMTPLPVPAGTALIFTGNFLHASLGNSSDASRRAITLHFASAGPARADTSAAAPPHLWSALNWMQPDAHAMVDYLTGEDRSSFLEARQVTHARETEDPA